MMVFQLFVWSPPPLDSWLRLQKNILYVKYHKKNKEKNIKSIKSINYMIFIIFFGSLRNKNRQKPTVTKVEK
ncbi:hypothetical protein CGT98_15680 [Vibrio metoecus]|nr:hypothetical protein CGT98_15680 [Vibrio metoecus]